MLNEYITALEPEPLPPVFIESEPPVPSEIVFAEEDEIVNMTDVAPFKEPVAGPVLARQCVCLVCWQPVNQIMD